MTRAADVILEQLGGNKFMAMTGAYALVATKNGLSFKLPNGTEAGINYVSIRLGRDDTYSLSFQRWCWKTLERVSETRVEGIYNANLRAVFTMRTGLDTSL